MSTTCTDAILTDAKLPGPRLSAEPGSQRQKTTLFFQSDIAILRYFCYNLFRNTLI